MRILTTRIFILPIFALLLLSGSKWETSYPMVSALLFCMGMTLSAIASLGRLWCSVYIAGHKDSRLVQDGPYSLCRNPLYFFSFIGVLGVGFASETLTIPAFLGVSFLLYYPWVIWREEKKLRAYFPDTLAAYFAKVPRFFPRHFTVTEPETCQVNPRLFRRHAFSALWFIWIIGLLELIEELHELGFIPVYFHFY